MRTPGSNFEDTWEAIRRAGVDLIYDHGFDSMNTRQLAEVVGMQSGSLYYYFKSKEDFLYRLVTDLLKEVIESVEASQQSADTPLGRLDAFVTTLVEWHVSRYRETFIARMEIRSLTDHRLDEYLALRRRFDEILSQILVDALEQGEISIHPDDLRLTRLSVLTMITGMTSWYSPTRSSTTTAEFVQFYVALVRRMLGATPAPRMPFARSTAPELQGS